MIDGNKTYPKISIITVVFNGAKTLEQTIVSVINQTYKNIEYIIIDGGSTDGTVDIIKQYEDRIAYWVSEPDKGIYDAMNKGIDVATGDIIGIINSDDYYDSNTVEYVVGGFQISNADIVHGNIILVLPDGCVYAEYSPPKVIKNLIWHDMAFYHPTCFVKKSIYKKYGAFSNSYKIAADYELLLKFYLNGVCFFYLEKDVAYFRLAGISDLSAELGMREVRDVSVSYGYNRILANLWYGYKVCARRIRNIFEYLGFNFIIEFYRKMRSNINFVKH